MVAECVKGARREEVISLLCDFSDLFDVGSRPAGVAQNIHHTINTRVSHPVSQGPYRVSSSEHETIQNEMDTMLSKSVIKPFSKFMVLSCHLSCEKGVDPCTFAWLTVTSTKSQGRMYILYRGLTAPWIRFIEHVTSFHWISDCDIGKFQWRTRTRTRLPP